jgi:hypothetical protein
MRTAIIMSRVICVFMGIVHLFGQLFFGVFALVPTIAGISGIIAGSLSAASRAPAKFLLLVAPLGVLAVGADAYECYASEQIPGNYYAWPEEVVFVGALLLIAYNALNRLRQKDEQNV